MEHVSMRVLVAGATGAIGQNLIPRLLAAGHQVFGTTRTEEKTGVIRKLGGEALVVNGLDGAAVRTAVRRANPDVIIHQMTDLKGASDLRRFDESFAVTNRLRTEGLDHLLAAARDADVKRFIAQSFCGWPFARVGGPVKSEDAPLDPSPPNALRRTLHAIRYLEDRVTGLPELGGIVLRCGAFYGPKTGLFETTLIEQILRRRVPVIGDGEGWWSFVHVEDAAAATALAVEGEDFRGIYNIVDDEPAPVREWLPALAEMLDAKSPRKVPAWLGRLLAGEHVMTMMTQVRAGTNAKAKRELGWFPANPTWRQGFARVIGQDRDAVHVRRSSRKTPSRAQNGSNYG
jgi:nucleoside-diphosphate-sugar epimerase